MSTEESKNKKQPKELSRREFLKDAGLVVGGAALGSVALLSACSPPAKTVTQTEAPVTLTATQTNIQTATQTMTQTATNIITAPPTTVITTVAPPSVTLDPYVVKLGYYNCDHMTAGAIGYDLGIYKQLGYSASITGSGNVPTAFAAGQMDVGYTGVGTVATAVVAGAPLLTVCDNFLGGSYYIVVSNAIDITKPEQLLGKKLAIGDKPEINASSWVEMCKVKGLPPEGSNYQTVTISGDSNKYLALAAGQIDGYTCCDPWGSMAEYNKIGKIFCTFTDRLASTGGAPKMLDCCCINMRKSFVQEHRSLAKKAVMGHILALQAMYLKPVKSAMSFAKNYGTPLEVAMMTVYKKTNGEGRMMCWRCEDLAERLDRTFAYYKDLGMVAYQVYPKASEYVDLSLYNEVMTENKWPLFDDWIKTNVDPIFPVKMSYDDWYKKALATDV